LVVTSASTDEDDDDTLADIKQLQDELPASVFPNGVSEWPNTDTIHNNHVTRIHVSSRDIVPS
jgi:hypothetical protein